MAERDIIARISKRQTKKASGLLAGIGDDCAVYRPLDGRLQLITCDSLIESVHFDFNWHPPDLLGEKAVSVNVSDIAAMGGEPRYGILALGLPSGCGSRLDDFLDGFSRKLEEYRVLLIGGDTVSTGAGFMITVTIIGEVVEKNVCYRSGAREGDAVWVSGSLGEAAAGLEICRSAPSFKDVYPGLVRTHLSPQARPELGSLLARSGLVGAMIDLSDGLATDLGHISAESGVGAEVFQDKIPIAPETVDLAEKLGLSPLNWALKGGEDYQLLFTTAPESRDALLELAVAESFELHEVGRIIRGSGVTLCHGGERRDITYQGYEHQS